MIAQARVAQDVNTAVMRKGRDVAEQQGEAAIQLLQAAAEIAQGPIHPDKGHRLDVIA